MRVHGFLDAAAQIGVAGDARAAGRGDLHHREPSPGARDDLREAGRWLQAARRFPWCSRAGQHRAPTSQHEHRTRSKSLAGSVALFLHRFAVPAGRGPQGAIEGNADRVRADYARMPMTEHRHVVAVRARLQRRDPPWQENCGSEAECGNPIRSAPRRPSSNSACQGQIPKASGLGQGICQKIATRASGRSFLTRRGSKAKVIILHKDHRLWTVLPSLQAARQQIAGLRAGSTPSRQRERWAAYAQCGKAAKAPRWRSPRSIAPLLPRTARPCARYSAVRRAARAGGRTRPRRRSASPVPLATQTPSHARSTGSSAVTSPLGGTTQTISLPLPHVHIRFAV